MNVGVRELKAHLSQYLGRVRAGELVVVTDRGKPVARIEPIDGDALPERLRTLVAEGRAVYRGRLARLPEPVDWAPGEKDSTAYVRDQRR